MKPLQKYAPEAVADVIGQRLDLVDRLAGERFTTRVDLVPDVAEWADGFVEGNPRNLIVAGPTGTGKTSQVWELIRELVEGGWRFTFRFVTGSTLADQMRPGEDRSENFDRAIGCTVLVVDDLTSMEMTAWQRTQFDQIINRRWELMMPTIITSNALDLRAEIGERAASRLAQEKITAIMRGADRRRAG